MDNYVKDTLRAIVVLCALFAAQNTFAADVEATRIRARLDGVEKIINYALPTGFIIVGADQNVGNGRVYLLGRNGSTCRVFELDIYVPANGATASLTTPFPTFDCSAAVADLEMLSVFEGHLIAAGNRVISYDPDTDRYETFNLSSANGTGIPNVVALAVDDNDPTRTAFGIDASSNTLVVLGNPDSSSSVPVAVRGPLGIAVANPVHLDSLGRGTILRMTSATSSYAVDPSSGAASTSFANLPAATLVEIFVTDRNNTGYDFFDDPQQSNDDFNEEGGGGGALGLGLLGGLLCMAMVRLQFRRRQ